MKRFITFLTIGILLLLVGQGLGWPRPSSLGLGLGTSMSSSGVVPSHGPSIILEAGGYILQEDSSTILME